MWMHCLCYCMLSPSLVALTVSPILTCVCAYEELMIKFKIEPFRILSVSYFKSPSERKSILKSSSQFLFLNSFLSKNRIYMEGVKWWMMLLNLWKHNIIYIFISAEISTIVKLFLHHTTSIIHIGFKYVDQVSSYRCN